MAEEEGEENTLNIAETTNHPTITTTTTTTMAGSFVSPDAPPVPAPTPLSTTTTTSTPYSDPLEDFNLQQIGKHVEEEGESTAEEDNDMEDDDEEEEEEAEEDHNNYSQKNCHDRDQLRKERSSNSLKAMTVSVRDLLLEHVDNEKDSAGNIGGSNECEIKENNNCNIYEACANSQNQENNENGEEDSNKYGAMIEKMIEQGPDFDVLSIPGDQLVLTATELIWKTVEEQGLSKAIERRDVTCFVQCACAEYGNPPFHNFYHAVSVLQAVQSLVSHCSLFTPEERLLLLFTALCHDAGHLGYTNNYLAQKFNVENLQTKTLAKDGTLDVLEEHVDETKMTSPLPSVHTPALAPAPAPVPTNATATGHLDSSSLSLSPPSASVSASLQLNSNNDQKEQQQRDSRSLSFSSNHAVKDPATLISKYGTLSPQEKHHVMVTLKLLRRHEKILKALLSGDLSNEIQSKRMACMVLHVILCTDLVLHKDLVNEMGEIGQGEAEFRSKLKAAALLMHAADLSNAARPFAANYEWSLLLNEEKRQLEGEESSNACTCLDDLPKGEVFFAKSFVLPTWEKARPIFGDRALEPWIERIKVNIANWEKEHLQILKQKQVPSEQLNQNSKRNKCTASCSPSSSTSSRRLARRRHRTTSAATITSFDSEDNGNTSDCSTCNDASSRLLLNYTDSFIVRSPAQKICCALLDDSVATPAANTA